MAKMIINIYDSNQQEIKTKKAKEYTSAQLRGIMKKKS
jgi:hypothetical protein